MATSIWNRKCDLLYLTFFLIHVPVMLCVDLTSLYPEAIKPTFLTTLRTYYITTYHDKFFSSPTAYFTLYTTLEALYHLPLSLYAIRALIYNNSPTLPLHLLIFALEAGLTTLTCIVDFMAWEDVTRAQKWELAKLYVPYLLLAVGMGMDMFARLSGLVLRRVDAGRVGKGGKSQ